MGNKTSSIEEESKQQQLLKVKIKEKNKSSQSNIQDMNRKEKKKQDKVIEQITHSLLIRKGSKKVNNQSSNVRSSSKESLSSDTSCQSNNSNTSDCNLAIIHHTKQYKSNNNSKDKEKLINSTTSKCQLNIKTIFDTKLVNANKALFHLNNQKPGYQMNSIPCLDKFHSCYLCYQDSSLVFNNTKKQFEDNLYSRKLDVIIKEMYSTRIEREERNMIYSHSSKQLPISERIVKDCFCFYCDINDDGNTNIKDDSFHFDDVKYLINEINISNCYECNTHVCESLNNNKDKDNSNISHSNNDDTKDNDCCILEEVNKGKTLNALNKKNQKENKTMTTKCLYKKNKSLSSSNLSLLSYNTTPLLNTFEDDVNKYHFQQSLYPNETDSENKNIINSNINNKDTDDPITTHNKLPSKALINPNTLSTNNSNDKANKENIRDKYFYKLYNKNIWSKQILHNEIVILDWDDTLLCTTFLTPLGFFQDNKLYDESDIKKIKTLEKYVYNILEKCILKADTFIVTNASSQWIEYSSNKFYPQITKLLENVNIISARETCERLYPGNQRRWKLETFKLIVDKFRRDVVTNIVCIGDSFIEMEAGQEIANKFKKSYIKSVKFKEAPKLEELVKQLKLLSSKFDDIFNSPKSLVVTVEKKDKIKDEKKEK